MTEVTLITKEQSLKAEGEATCKHCGKPVWRCERLPDHGGCSSAFGWIHAVGWRHSCGGSSSGSVALPAGNPGVLFRDPSIFCQQDVPDWEDDENGLIQCQRLSGFVVERSDGDKTFGWDGKHEACEYDLADVIDGMLGGDATLKAVVTPRWRNDPEGPTA